MNRNRVSDGRRIQATSRRPPQGQAGDEVIYVGRASFWTEQESQLFQEMPEAPGPAQQVARAGVVTPAGVPAPIAPAPSGATVILGINLSGPIVFQTEPQEERGRGRERREDSNPTSLPAGEMSLPRAVRGSFPSAFTSLMTVTIVAFAMGLVVSPLGRAPASRGAPTAPLAQARAATIQPLPAVTPTAPLIVPTTLPPIAAHSTSPLPRAKSSPSRASRDGVSHERVQTVARKHGPGSKMWTAASVRASAASARAAADANAEGDDGDRPSRKSLEKESVDLTKQGADSLARKSAAKPWVDPWAD